jgi:hypothetical protein
MASLVAEQERCRGPDGLARQSELELGSYSVVSSQKRRAPPAVGRHLRALTADAGVALEFML